MIICGIDPTSGADSALGIAFFNTETLTIHMEAVRPPKEFKKELRLRVKALAERLKDVSDLQRPDLVFIESTVMRGKGGESLARATGAFMIQPHQESEVKFVSNKTVKKVVGGHGSADKLMVAEGVATFFKPNKESVNKVQTLIDSEAWDQLDALAIAITGWVQHQNEI